MSRGQDGLPPWREIVAMMGFGTLGMVVCIYQLVKDVRRR